MTVPPIILLALGAYPIIAGMQPLLTATGQVVSACVSGTVAIAGLPFAAVAQLGVLLNTAILPLFFTT